MKILIGQPSSNEDKDCTCIKSFDEFISIPDKDFDSITEIRFNEFLLGMSCLYWMVDNRFDSIGKIHFVISVTDKERASSLCTCLRQYMRKFEKIRGKYVAQNY